MYPRCSETASSRSPSSWALSHICTNAPSARTLWKTSGRRTETRNSDGGSGERGAAAGVGPDGERRRGSASGGDAGILGDAEGSAGCVPVRERQSRQDMLELGRTGPTNGFWRDAEWIYCRDGKWRPTQPGISPLVNGAAERLVRSSNPSAPLEADNTAEARTLRLRGYGDGIVAPLAVEFIQAAMEWKEGER